LTSERIQSKITKEQAKEQAKEQVKEANNRTKKLGELYTY